MLPEPFTEELILHEILQRECRHEEKRSDEKQRSEEEFQKLVAGMIASAAEGAGFLHRITKPTALRGGLQVLEVSEQDATPLRRCEEERKEWTKHWQCDFEVEGAENKPWWNEELRSLEEGLPRLKKENLEK